MLSQERPKTRLRHISRTRIASAAARIMAEDGMADIERAKQKAARQLGLPESAALPDNAEVEAELRLYQALYQSGQQPENLRQLREQALKIMERLSDFRPYITGPVLEGTAGLFSAIDLVLFADSAKEVEIFLLNQNIPFEHLDPRALRKEHAEAALRLNMPEAEVTLTVLPAHFERQNFHHRDGRTKQRARREALAQLLRNGEDTPFAPPKPPLSATV